MDRLYKKDTVWRWDPEHQRALEGIKSVISSLPVLAYFDAKSERTIQCDTSKQGLGTVLLQEGKPVMYISRTLTETEQRYSNIERELLAVVFALERLNHYTAGYRVKVETDHEPLTSIWKKSIASTSTRVQRLLLRLLQYDIDIHYLPGKRNVIAERFVRTVKDTLTKAHQSGQDPDMALLCYRSTPINSKLPSPAELMNSRRYRTLLPTRTMLKSREEEREELMSLKRKQEQHYNKTAQTLPELNANMKVYVQLQPHSRDWKPATVTECLEYNRYKVQLDFNGKEYIRNRIYIKPRTDEPRSKRTIRKPSRYHDYHT